MHVGQDFPKQSVLVVFWQDFASPKSLMKNVPRSLLKALPTQCGAAEVLTPEPCRVWAQSGQEFPLEAVHPLQYHYLHILVSNAQALRGLSLIWPHSFQRPSHCGKGVIHAVTSPMWNSPKTWPLIRVHWHCPSGFWRKASTKELCLSPGHLLGWLVPFPIQSTWSFLAWIPVVLLVMSSIFAC